MSEPDLPVPEPTEEDERLALDFIRIKDETSLKGTPEGDQRCDNCHFYLEMSEDISYCWHDKLEIMVGGEWWCDRWEAIDAVPDQPTEEERKTGMLLKYDKVEDQQWVNEPKFGEKCDDCLFYLSPDESVSYCWHPKLRVGVGADHWCQWWEPAPETEANAY
jgi:hypothetical protein